MVVFTNPLMAAMHFMHETEVGDRLIGKIRDRISQEIFCTKNVFLQDEVVSCMYDTVLAFLSQQTI